MPTYEYKCNACGREFEVQQRMVDDDLVDCEVCGKPALEKLISRTAFTLKGGGWYKDLYASSKPESKSTSDASAATASSDSSSTASASSSDSSSSSSSGSSGSSGSGSSGTSGSSGSSGSSSGGGTSSTKAASSAP